MTISWDKLRDDTQPQKQALTAFISEQDPLVFAAARHRCVRARHCLFMLNLYTDAS
jgi:hypothetical protein